MKLITAIIKPSKLDDVREALSEIRVEGMTVAKRGIRKSTAAPNTPLPKLKVEVAVPAEMADRVVEAMTQSARTGKIGDGKIFVCDLDLAMRIRTSETGPQAL